MTLKQKINLMLSFGLASILASSCSAGDVVQEQYQESGGRWAPVGTDQSFSLCERDEEIYFSCLTSNEKKISLCADRPENEGSNLTYRFGRGGNVELEHSASLEPGHSSSPSGGGFLKNRYFRARVDYTEVAFNSNDHEYRVFRRFSDESVDQQASIAPSRDFGVEVSVASSGEGLAVISCSKVHVDKLIELSNLLACDDSSALGCADP